MNIEVSLPCWNDKPALRNCRRQLRTLPVASPAWLPLRHRDFEDIERLQDPDAVWSRQLLTPRPWQSRRRSILHRFRLAEEDAGYQSKGH
jgi:hypothetical protein